MPSQHCTLIASSRDPTGCTSLSSPHLFLLPLLLPTLLPTIFTLLPFVPPCRPPQRVLDSCAQSYPPLVRALLDTSSVAAARATLDELLAARPSSPLKKADDLPDATLDLAATSLQQGFCDGMARLPDIRAYLLALQRCVTPVLEDFYAAAEAHELCALVAGGCLQIPGRTYLRAAGRGAGCKPLLRVLTTYLLPLRPCIPWQARNPRPALPAPQHSPPNGEALRHDRAAQCRSRGRRLSVG